jgi:FlaA1/EpsC-like NDP-sugar epimerase
MGERLMSAANGNLRGNGPIFASTRFGNVLGSRGSVIPIFRKQIKSGGPVTLTDPKMTRFIMSIGEAVQLVIDSAILAQGGEVFVTKMPVIRIEDLAEVMVEKLGPRYGIQPGRIEIKIIGVKPGEKMYEELMNHEETRRALELERYFVVLPAFKGAFRNIEYRFPKILSEHVTDPYNSANEKPLSKAELREFLIVNHLLDEDSYDQEHPAERCWPNSSSKT